MSIFTKTLIAGLGLFALGGNPDIAQEPVQANLSSTITVQKPEEASKEKSSGLETNIITGDITAKPERLQALKFNNSDYEHANFCGNVIDIGAVALQVYEGMEKESFTIVNGRILHTGDRYSGDGNNPPKVALRPIDGNQEIYVKGKISYSFNGDSWRMKLKLKPEMPNILNPEITLESLVIDGENILPSSVKINYQYTIDPEDMVAKGLLSKAAISDDEIEIDYAMKIMLKEYKRLKPDMFGSFSQLRRMPVLLKARTNFKPGDFLDKIAYKLMKDSKTPYEFARKVFDYTRKSITYHYNELYLDAADAIKEKLGDCDDFAEIMRELLKRGGIPVIENDAEIIDFDDPGGHDFVVFALPMKGKGFRWMLAEPTWAAKKKKWEKYLQQTDRSYVFDFNIEVDTYGDKLKYSTVFSSGFSIDEPVEDLEKKASLLFNKMAKDAKTKNLMFRREYNFARESSFFLQKSKISKNGNFLLNLNMDDWLEVSYQAKDGELLSGKKDNRQIARLKSLDAKMRAALKLDKDAELLYFMKSRDAITDKVESAQIIISPYLVEREMPKILEVLENANYITHKRKKKILRLYELTHGRNMYHVLNLVRML